MLWGVEYEKKERKRRKREKRWKREKKVEKGIKGGKGKKRWKRKAVCCPSLAEQDLHPLCYEERLSHLREMNNFKIRGSAGQKAPL